MSIMKDKAYIKYIGNCVYPVMIGIAVDKKSYEKETQRLGCDVKFTNVHGEVRTFFNNKTNAMVAIISINVDKIGKNNKQDIVYTLVHECSHVVDFIFEYIKEEKPTTEMRAYLLEWIFIRSCEILKDKGIK